ncbi:MAG: hypothetical protein H6706_19290 [Myxococcales bacterium]|nr:hypothetical protein [Myxococcales bacterium]
MSGILQSLDLRLRQALDGDLSPRRVLLRLLTDELERQESLADPAGWAGRA